MRSSFPENIEDFFHEKFIGLGRAVICKFCSFQSTIFLFNDEIGERMISESSRPTGMRF